VKDLLEEHVPRVYRFALRLTGDGHQAEDLTQEVFLKAWRNRSRLRDRGAVRVWLFRIAVNLWRDDVRRQRRRARRGGPPAAEQQGMTMPPERELVVLEDLGRALKAMDGLPTRQREVLYLPVCEELPLAEIAGILDISSDAVKASLSVARKKIRRQLRDVCRDHFPTM
jgi:RNA polymerase sigma-70 factor (ECF subfamily)